MSFNKQTILEIYEKTLIDDDYAALLEVQDIYVKYGLPPVNYLPFVAPVGDGVAPRYSGQTHQEKSYESNKSWPKTHNKKVFPQTQVGEKKDPDPLSDQALALESEVHWYYQDDKGVERGPFERETMKKWADSGFLNPKLKVRRGRDLYYTRLFLAFDKLNTAFESKCLIPSVQSQLLFKKIFAKNGFKDILEILSIVSEQESAREEKET